MAKQKIQILEQKQANPQLSMERLRSKMENLNQKKDKLEEILTEKRTEKEELTKKSEKLKAENATFEWDALKSTEKLKQVR